jgi:hypothetical protein
VDGDVNELLMGIIIDEYLLVHLLASRKLELLDLLRVGPKPFESYHKPYQYGLRYRT